MAGQGAAPGGRTGACGAGEGAGTGGGAGAGGGALAELEVLLHRHRAAVLGESGEGALAARKQLLGALLRELESRGNLERQPVMELSASLS